MPLSGYDPLPLARARLEDAVHALADPAPVWDHGVCRWSDSTYSRLRVALTAGRGVRGRAAMPGSRAPCRINALTLLLNIDQAVAGWLPDGKGTVERLHELAGRGWRPQDTELLGIYSTKIEGWILAAAELLGDRAVAVALRMPCPNCGERWSYRYAGAEEVRGWALRVSEDGCECRGCKAFWPPDQFEWLARLLGCEPLPA